MISGQPHYHLPNFRFVRRQSVHASAEHFWVGQLLLAMRSRYARVPKDSSMGRQTTSGHRIEKAPQVVLIRRCGQAPNEHGGGRTAPHQAHPLPKAAAAAARPKKGRPKKQGWWPSPWPARGCPEQRWDKAVRWQAATSACLRVAVIIRPY